MRVYLSIPKTGTGTSLDPVRPDYLDRLGVGYGCISDAESPNSAIGAMLIRADLSQVQLDDLKGRNGVVEAARTAQEVRQWLDSLSLTAQRWLLALQSQRQAMALRGVRNVPIDPRQLVKTPADELPSLPLDLSAIEAEWRTRSSDSLSKQALNDLWKHFKRQWNLSTSDRRRLMDALRLRPATEIASESWTGNDNDPWPAQWVAPAIGADVGYQIDTNNTQVDDATGEGRVGGTAAPDAPSFAVIDAVDTEDVEILADWTTNASASDGAVCARVHQDTNPRDTYYYYRDESDDQEIHKVVAGTDTRILNSVSTGHAPIADKENRFQCESDGAGGTDLRIRQWLDTESEPATWDAEVNDTEASLQSVTGAAGVGAVLGVSTGRHVYFDNLVMDDLQVAGEEGADVLAARTSIVVVL